MNQYSNRRAGSLATRILGFIALLVGVAVLYSIFVPNAVKEDADKPVITGENQPVSRKCEDDLAGVIEALAPGRLGISSDRVTTVNRLNSWQTDCVAVGNTPAAGNEIEAAKQLLSGETLTRTLSEKFLPEDVSHVRNSLLMRQIVARVTEGKPNNPQRYVALFNFVCRNEMLVPEDILKDLPLTPYESLVFGMGSPEHRAWTFCDLLRQMRVDVVIITPREKGLEKNFLIGVIDPTEGIFLFDPALGMPIPPPGAASKDDTAKLPAATFAQVLESDEPFRQLDIPDSPYPLKSELMKSVKVSLIGTSSSWAPRMAQLQFMLPSRFSAELYDGLAESELRSPGLKQRIVDAGKNGAWTAEDVGIWNFSGEQIIAMEATRGEGAKGSILETFHTIFRGPYLPQSTDDQGNYKMVPIDKSLHFVRVEQLKGNQAAALKDFLPIRSAAKMAPNRGNDLAAEYATLWTGIAQFETRKYTVAFNTLGRLVSGQASSTSIVRAGMEMGAECLVAEKEYAAAAKLLAQAPPGLSPRRDALLIREWEKIAGVKPEEKKPENVMPATEKAGEKPAKPDAKPAPESAEKMKEKPKDESAKTEGPSKSEDKKLPASKPSGEMAKPEAKPEADGK